LSKNETTVPLRSPSIDFRGDSGCAIAEVGAVIIDVNGAD